MDEHDEEFDPNILDMLMGNGFMLEVFMLQVAIEIGRMKPGPQEWARSFIDALHARLDANEGRMNDRRYPTHELARQGFDRLGAALTQILRLPPDHKP